MANKLVLELIADSNNLLKALEQSQKSLNSFIRASETAGQSLGGGVNRALDNFMGLAKGGAVAAGILAGGVLAAAGAATALVESAGRQAEVLEQTSQKTGIAVTTLQSWTVAMAQSGLGMDSLTRGVKTLSDQIVQSRNPNSQAAEKFAELGLTATSVDGVLEQLADRFDMMPDGADKTRIAVELFGKAGQDLIPILNRGSAGFRESMEQSKALGAVLSTETVKALSTADDAFDTLGVATKAASNQLAGLMAPAVTAVTESLTKGIGVVATFFGALNEGSKGGENTIQFLKTLNPLIQKMGGPGFNVEAMEKQAKDMAAFGEATKQLHDEMIAKLEAEGRVQEDMGKRILVDNLTKWRAITAEMKAQEQLGRNVNAIAEADRKERNAAFARELQQQEEVNNLQFAPATLSDGMKAHEAAVENLIRLMPELNHQEAALQVLLNQQVAHDAIVSATAAYKDRNKELELGVEYARADFQQQQSWYQQAPGLIGQAELAREKGFDLLLAENDLRRQMIEETIFDEDRKNVAILALDVDLNAKRRQIIQQFPTFWEQQLQAIVASNAFSISSIMSSFNQATAMWIQGKGTFDDFIQQTQTTLIQSTLQATEQWLAQLALAQLRELGLIKTQEAAKTALKVTGDTSRVASNATADAAIVASNTTAASASATIWGASFASVMGAIELLGTAVKAFFVETLWPMIVEFATSVVGVLEAIASALGLSALFGNVGGIFAAGVLLAAVAGITAAVAMGAFASGGIVTGPTLGLMGEAGSPEAAIPLNDRGAAFMQKTMGLGGAGGNIHVEMRIDSKKIGEALLPALPGAYKLHARGL